MASLERTSPLADRCSGAHAATFDGRTVRLRERAFAGILWIQARDLDADVLQALESRLGLTLPLEPNTRGGTSPHGLWIAPGEWLAVTEQGQEHGLAVQISAILGDRLAAVTVVSDSRAIIELSGPGAVDVLSAGCGLDLHPRSFGPGSCARTRLAEVAALIHQRTEEPAFDIHVDRPIAGYLWDWLVDAAGEF